MTPDASTARPASRLPVRRRSRPIDRLVGVAPQFTRTDGGFFYRRDGWGPAIRVTEAERDAFVRAGRWATGLHIAALVICLWAARLVVRHVLAEHGDIAVAIGFGVVGAIVTMILYASLQWHGDAAGRALAGRPAERPAGDPEFDAFHTYGAILGATTILLFMAATGLRGSTAYHITFATAAVMVGVFLLLRKWLAESRLTPEQRDRARARLLVRRVGKPDSAPVEVWALWRIALLLVFFFLELIAIGGGVAGGLAIATQVTGQAMDDLSFVAGALGFVAGLGLAALGIIVLEFLCIRLTYQSAFSIIAALGALPW